MHTYLYRARKDAPPLHRLTESQRAELVESIGATEIVRMKLDELFPDLQWVRIAGVWSGGHAVCQTPYVDILLSEDPPGTCRFIVLNKADAPIVRMVMQSFGLNYACVPESGSLT